MYYFENKANRIARRARVSDHEAQFELGRMYFCGDCEEQSDVEAAYEYFVAAAELGYEASAEIVKEMDGHGACLICRNPGLI